MQIWQDEWIILGTIDKTIDLCKIQDGDEILIMILVGLGGVFGWYGVVFCGLFGGLAWTSHFFWRTHKA